MKQVTHHTCRTIGDATRVQVQKVYTKAKQRAAATIEQPVQIRMNVIQNETPAVLGKFN